MKIMHIPLGNLGTNCYLCHEDGKAVMIDVGMYSDKLIDLLGEKNLTLEYILLTHGHFDHTTGVEKLKEKTGAKVCILSAEEEMLGNASLNGAGSFGMEYDDNITADILFDDGDVLSFGSENIKVIATPGHTVGGCCYYFENEKVLFSGDTLFRQSIGRTDLWGGDYDTLIQSINEKLMVMEDDVFICPGHGTMSNIGYERANNPYIR